MRNFEPPPSPKSLKEAGLPLAFVDDLVLKHLMFLGQFTMADVAEKVKLPISIVEYVLEEHRRENLIEVKGSASYTKTSYVFRLTEAGRRRGHEALEQSRYAGPAPVSVTEYTATVQRQTIKGAIGSEDILRKALSHLIVRDTVLRRLGPAMISGQAVFLYGPSGNGKTSIAEAIGRALPENIYIPYAVTVGGQVVSVFDPVVHLPVEPEESPQGDYDQRWVLVRRPVVNAGGELSLHMLDLNFHHSAKYYEASLQMKANNGLFILDDFGRQQVDPLKILNRWLVPLERQVDHMTFLSGMKFAIPFDVLVIFSTELDPKDLVHEAFLRRLRYKIKIDRPSEEEYLAIFKKACEANGMEFNQEVYSYLEEHWYVAHGIARSACHPRDILELIATRSRYYDNPPQLTLDNISAACTDYFAPM
jgi:predicted ATPase with chaperone activity